MLWDLFCRVVDNFGDVGVCWRAAADLASRGERVRLWLDDTSALAWMAPSGHTGVAVHGWDAAAADVAPGDVVIEAFGCDPPAAFVERMARAPRPPVWINLEYLSAEPYVERSHGLPSPQLSGAGAGLTKWFFYPGFTPATGGLLRERGLIERLARFDRDQWFATRGITLRPEERVVSLFCYDNPAVAPLLDALADEPTLLLAAAGPAAMQVDLALGLSRMRRHLRAALLPYLPQTEYDCLLGASDVNFVRGEDSFVRAQWAGRPFVWQIYPQDDAAHAAKLDAFLDRFLAGAPSGLAVALRGLWHGWNGLSSGPVQLPDAAAWQSQVLAWRDGLLAQADLIIQLMGFVEERR
ncbi:elongation factor P maturation arginine rhamnosyltransferase EarP [Dokdonella sp.]|uniref:elongation factor P maturation arginine rhamnosyltransferase EarP n=1 Tax=Dokdonella sp. TaxID=2291710 RepID=UPI0027BA5A72|nr:elongation factor P maturation arginine rhamnosyltransferase EarP [Dokdonella sp.]